MRYSEFWTRMDEVLGVAYAETWAKDQVIGLLGSRTVMEALDAGVPPKEVWRAVCHQLGLPPQAR
ncbi:DUF3046 domain-containing protein [Nocardioides aestuarii]|uniref:DUF3046 domain-containing protein n=1 Tax=Nocardioides aestuarii TaxID=252231 RepID=A0ABW4TVA2_9ACTN